MSDRDLRALAQRAGIAVDWTDANGTPQQVGPETLRALLPALGLPCRTAANLADSTRRLRAATSADASMITVTRGATLRLAGTSARLTLEDGRRHALTARREGSELVLRVNAPPGYHRLEIGRRRVTLAVAPKRCCTVADAAPGRRIWGLAAQIYSLPRRGDGGIGDTGAIAALAQQATRLGADAIALSPSHAMFGADLQRYGPYSPSSRLFLNPLLADPAAVFGAAALQPHTSSSPALIDWTNAAAAKLALLRRLYTDVLPRNRALAGEFQAYQKASGALLQDHALFEVLHGARLQHDRAQWNWQSWPAAWRNPRSPALGRFARAHEGDIRFHMFLQWVAERAFAVAQKATRDAGMRIGLIADVAVGMDAGGSHAWSRQADLLVGLSVGAPPDLFNPRGQNWGLTAFSPQALQREGFAPYLATLRAAMRHAGGVRIDHAMGLARLWLIPEGAGAGEGAYVAYPLDDLLRLTALESRRHKSVVIAEDLGTVPEGFRERLDDAGIAGMRVLWFEREGDAFRAPKNWDENTAALTTTHDLPTVAGWWRGADIRTRAKLKLLTPREEAAARRARTQERQALWRSFRAAGVARGQPPKSSQTDKVVDAAIGFVARTRSRLTLIPIEDALGLVEQPNLPGTIDEHPNWRRRLTQPADALLAEPKVRQRLASLKRRRA